MSATGKTRLQGDQIIPRQFMSDSDLQRFTNLYDFIAEDFEKMSGVKQPQLHPMMEDVFKHSGGHNLKITFAECILLAVYHARHSEIPTNVVNFLGVCSQTAMTSAMAGYTAIANAFDHDPCITGLPTLGMFMPPSIAEKFDRYRNGMGIIDGRHTRNSGQHNGDARGKRMYSFKLNAKGVTLAYVCNLDGQVVFVSAVYPGSVHDSTVYNLEKYNIIERFHFLQYRFKCPVDELIILADDGYSSRDHNIVTRPSTEQTLPNETVDESQQRISQGNIFLSKRGLIESFFGRQWNTFKFLRTDTKLGNTNLATLLKALCHLTNWGIKSTPLHSVDAMVCQTNRELDRIEFGIPVTPKRKWGPK